MIFIEVALNLQVALDRTALLKIFSLPRRGHRVSFYLYLSQFLLVTFCSVHEASTALLIPKHFSLFDAVMNGIVTFLLDCCLLLYRSAADLGVLILHPANLPNL